MKFYSQARQDEWVLKNLDEKRNGYFIECGAFDGIRISNTYVLEKEFNWKGICIEADKKIFKKLKKNRKCICINAYVSDTITLKEILDKSKAPKIIDYLSLDVDGTEEKILKDFPFNEYTFLTMSIERPSVKLRKLLRKNGYMGVHTIWISGIVLDVLYIHKSLGKGFSFFY